MLQAMPHHNICVALLVVETGSNMQYGEGMLAPTWSLLAASKAVLHCVLLVNGYVQVTALTKGRVCHVAC